MYTFEGGNVSEVSPLSVTNELNFCYMENRFPPYRVREGEGVFLLFFNRIVIGQTRSLTLGSCITTLFLSLIKAIVAEM